MGHAREANTHSLSRLFYIYLNSRLDPTTNFLPYGYLSFEELNGLGRHVS